VLNDCHTGVCGGHLSELETAQNILRAGYFWPTLIKDCIETVKKCHSCQIFSRKMREHLAPMFPVITIGPFTKWGIDYTTCNPHQHGGIAISLWLSTTLLSGSKPCRRSKMMERPQLSSYLIRLSHGSESRERLSLTMVVTFKIKL
jgi:hypothetical protein